MPRRVAVFAVGGLVVVGAAVAAFASFAGNGGPAPDPAGRSASPAETPTILSPVLPPPTKPPPAPPPVSPPAASRPAPPPPDPLPDPPGYNPAIVTPRPGMANVHPVAWRRAQVLDERTLRIHFESGVAPCSVLDRVETAYSADAITVTLFEGSDPAFGDAVCILIAQFKAVDVPLSEPVNGRSIVDGGR